MHGVTGTHRARYILQAATATFTAGNATATFTLPLQPVADAGGAPLDAVGAIVVVNNGTNQNLGAMSIGFQDALGIATQSYNLVNNGPAAAAAGRQLVVFPQGTGEFPSLTINFAAAPTSGQAKFLVYLLDSLLNMAVPVLTAEAVAVGVGGNIGSFTAPADGEVSLSIQASAGGNLQMAVTPPGGAASPAGIVGAITAANWSVPIMIVRQGRLYTLSYSVAATVYAYANLKPVG